MSHVQKTPRNSPEFVKIIQSQNKLADDSQIIEDSLLTTSILAFGKILTLFSMKIFLKFPIKIGLPI